MKQTLKDKIMMYCHILIGGNILGFFGYISIEGFRYISLKSIEYGQDDLIVKILFSIFLILMWLMY